MLTLASRGLVPRALKAASAPLRSPSLSSSSPSLYLSTPSSISMAMNSTRVASRTFFSMPQALTSSFKPLTNRFMLFSKGFGKFDPKNLSNDAKQAVEKNSKKWGPSGSGGPGKGPNYNSILLLSFVAMAMSYGLTNLIMGPIESAVTWRQFEQHLLHSGEIDRIECRTGMARIFLRNPIAIPRVDPNAPPAASPLAAGTSSTSSSTDAPALAATDISSSSTTTPSTPTPSTPSTPPSPAPAATDAAAAAADAKVEEDEKEKEKEEKKVEGAFIYNMKIGPVESFERKIEMLQRENGVAARDLIPVELVKDDSGSMLSGILVSAFQILMFVGILVLAQRYMANKMGGGGIGGGIMGMGNSAKRFKKENVKVKFADVAGCDQAKMEIKEFVEFLQNSDKFKKLGAKIPRGALLTGPPGTGKTLLAKATAGEAGVPFYSAAGSDFVELYVGMGAKRARELFEEARKNSPCIIFIDEIDAIGKQRSRSGTGANDERDQTLNALLVEMDGFDQNHDIVVLAGTNRADMLDAALTRPGRFDRKITVEKPDLNGRKAIFEIHLPKVKINGDVPSFAARLSGLTPGFTGADIATLCNEAAIIAARQSKDFIDMSDFEKAVDRVLAGAESTKIMSVEEKRIVAFHEAGHAVAGWFLQHADPLMKVTIIPRGSGALGFAQYLPKELYLMGEEQIMDRVCMALAGRAAEEIIFGKVTTGASDDLKRVTQIIYDMIQVYGMNPKLGNVSYPRGDGMQEKLYSEATAELIDAEAQQMVSKAYQRTLQLIRDRKKEVTDVAHLLMTKETITNLDVSNLIGPRPFPMSAEYAIFVESGWSNPVKKEQPAAAPTDVSSSNSDSSNSNSSNSANSSSNSNEAKTDSTENKTSENK